MPRTMGILLAFVAGWVDASSFVGLDHVMAAHVTGNLVVLGARVSEGFTSDDTLKIVILPIFFLGVMLVTVLHDHVIARIRDSRLHLPCLLDVETALIALTGVFGAWVTLAGYTIDFWIALLIVTPVTIGMALQNALHRLYPDIGPATTVMTGNITQFFIDKTRRLGGHLSESKINDMPTNENILPLVILAFGVGCVMGAVLTSHFGNGTFLVPAVVTLVCSMLLRRQIRRSADHRREEAKP